MRRGGDRLVKADVGVGIAEMMTAAWPGVPDMQTSYDTHVRIFTAIRKGSAAAARRAMARHMDLFRKELQQVGLLKK